MAKPVEALLSHDTVFGAATAGFPALDQALVDRALHEAAAETHRLSEEFRHLRAMCILWKFVTNHSIVSSRVQSYR